MTRFLLAAAIVTGFAGAAAAQDTMDQETFRGTVKNTGVFSSWDSDADGMISEEEFSDGMFSMYDQDGDGSLSSDETSDFQGERLFDSNYHDSLRDASQAQ